MITNWWVLQCLKMKLNGSIRCMEMALIVQHSWWLLCLSNIILLRIQAAQKLMQFLQDIDNDQEMNVKLWSCVIWRVNGILWWAELARHLSVHGEERSLKALISASTSGSGEDSRIYSVIYLRWKWVVSQRAVLLFTRKISQPKYKH